MAEVTRGALGPPAGGGSQPAAGMELGGLWAPSQPSRSALLRSRRFLPTRPFCGCSLSLCTERGWRLCFRKHRLGLEGTLKIIQQMGRKGPPRSSSFCSPAPIRTGGQQKGLPGAFCTTSSPLAHRCSVPCIFSPGHGAEAIPAPPCWSCLVFCAPMGGSLQQQLTFGCTNVVPHGLTPGKQLGAARRPGARCARQECGSALRRCPDSASYHPPGFCWVSGLENSQHQFGALRDPGGQLWDPTSIQHGQVRSVDPRSIQHGQVRSVGSHIHTAWPGEVSGSHIHTAWPGEVSGIPYSMAR